MEKITSTSGCAHVDLADGTRIDSVDAIVHATGWKGSNPIPFDTAELAEQLGLSSVSKSSHEWDDLEQEVESQMRATFNPDLFKRANPRPVVHHLFRRQASPSLIAEGDRSFAVLGAGSLGAVALVAEVQALWVAAFLTGGLDGIDGPLNDFESVRESIAQDVVWSKLAAVGLGINALRVCSSCLYARSNRDRAMTLSCATSGWNRTGRVEAGGGR